MKHFKTFTLIILSLLFLKKIDAQRPSYLEFSYAIGTDFMKFKNYSGEIKEMETTSSLANSFALGYSAPLYKSLRFRSDLIFFQTKSLLKLDYDTRTYNSIVSEYVRGWFINQSILNSHGLEFHYSYSKVILASNIGVFMGMDTRKIHSNEIGNFSSSLRSGINLGSEFKFVGKHMNIGLGINYLYFDPQHIFNTPLSRTGLQYSTHSLMARLTFSYKING